MARKTLTAILVLLASTVLIIGCAKKSVSTDWANSFRPLNARFHRIALFTDALVVRHTDFGNMIPMNESLDLSSRIDKEVTEQLSLLNYSVAANEKFFIGAYGTEPMKVSDDKDTEPGDFNPPFHLDPDVLHSESYSKDVQQAFKDFAKMIADGQAGLGQGRLPESIVGAISRKYNLDAVALVIAVSRQPETKEMYGPLAPDSVFKYRAPFVAIGVFHGYDGKLLWYGITTYDAPVLPSVLPRAAKDMLADFPPKGEGPYFANPNPEK